MKAVNVNEVLKILYNYGQFIPVTDGKKYRKMMDEIANLPSMSDTMLGEIETDIKHLVYYWCEVNPNSVIDDVLKIIDKYKKEDKK